RAKSSLAEQSLKEKARRLGRAFPQCRSIGLVAVVTPGPVVPVGRFARDAEFEVPDLVFQPPRFTRLDSVARRPENAALQAGRLVFERASLAPRKHAASLQVANVAADPLHSAFHRPSEIHAV